MTHPRTLILLFCTVASLPLQAQEVLTINTAHHCIFSGGKMDEELYRFSGNTAVDARILEIVALVDSVPNFEWIQSNVENATAVVDGDKRYLLYSLDFIEKAEDIEVYAMLAHEIGHLLNGHQFTDLRRMAEEWEADWFMGFVLSKKGFSRQNIDVLVKKLPSSYGLPGDLLRRIALAGFDQAEKALEIKSLPFDNDPKLEGLTLPGFPWPPPSCNTRFDLPESACAGFQTLGDADRKIRLALDARGYAQRSYFSVPNGFAVVSQLEQYNATDASVRNDRTRWLDYPACDNFAGVMDYLTSFVMPQKGYFRLFVFVVTNQSFGGSTQRVTKDQASAWLNQGFNKLPAALAAMPYGKEYGVTTLVYEFEVPESNRKPIQKCPTPRFDARTHLKQAGLAKGLGF